MTLFAKNMPVATELDWERDGHELKCSLFVNGEWIEHTVKERPLRDWLKDSGYLSVPDYYGPENDFKGSPRPDLTYSEFLDLYLDDEIVKAHLFETGKYQVI